MLAIPNSKNRRKQSENLIILQWNKGGSPFLNKMDELLMIIKESKPHILIISEANVQQNIHLASMSIQDYNIENDLRLKKNVKGNMVVYIKNSVNYKRRFDLENEELSNIWIEVKIDDGKKILINGGYREWCSQIKGQIENESGRSIRNQLQRLQIMTNSWIQAAKEEKAIIITGDWNVDMLMWTCPATNNTTHNQNRSSLLRQLIAAAAEANLTLLTKRATRFQGADKPSALDLILTNKPEIVGNIIFQIMNSDHMAIKCHIKTRIKETPKVPRMARTYKNYSAEKCQQMARKINTEHIMKMVDSNKIAKEINNSIIHILDEIAPTKKFTSRVHYAPHITETTKQLMQQRNNLRKEANSTQDEDKKLEYRKTRNKVVQLIKKDKRTWLQKQMEGNINTAKMLWKATNKVSGKQEDRSIRELSHNGITIKEKIKIAETLNENFKQKIIKIKKNLKKQEVPYEQVLENTKQEVPDMELLAITRNKMDKVIKSLKKSGANGFDTITSTVLKDIYVVWHAEILHLTNISLCTGVFPDELKRTKILPSLKKGKQANNPSNYRPISSLPMLGKVIEKCGFEQLKEHCEKYNIITKDQHGGRCRHSTTTCLLELQEQEAKMKGEGLKTAIIAVDLSAAYDLVSHQVMDQQLRLVGAGNLFRKFTKGFLSKRNQQVEVEGVNSHPIESLDMGLCQGGYSSGTLFAIHTNEIPIKAQENSEKQQQPQQEQTTKINELKQQRKKKRVEARIVKLFVDDTTGLAAAKDNESLQKILQQLYDKIEKHLQNLGMAINPEKTQVTVLNPDKEGKEVFIMAAGKIIKHQPKLTVLGFSFHEDRKMDEHLWRGENNLIKSLRSQQSMLRVIKPYTTKIQLGKIANAVVNSKITYLAPLWSLTSEANKERVQSAQTKILRQLNWTRRKSYKDKCHRQSLFEEWKWPNVEQLCRISTIQIVRKSALNMSTEELNSFYNFRNNDTCRLENSFKIYTEKTTKRSATNILDKGRLYYNELPTDLRNTSLSQKLFKLKLKAHVMTKHKLEKH